MNPVEEGETVKQQGLDVQEGLNVQEGRDVQKVLDALEDFDIQEKYKIIADLELKNALLTSSVYSTKIKLKDLDILIAKSTKEQSSLTNEVTQLKKGMQKSREAADHTHKCVQDNHDKLVLLHAEMDRQTDNNAAITARRNAQYGKVDISHHNLLVRYNDLKASYSNLQQVYAEIFGDYSKLHAEHASIVSEYNNALTDFQIRETDQLSSLEWRICELEEANARLTVLVNTPVKVVAALGPPEMQFIEDMVSKTARDIKALEMKLEQQQDIFKASCDRIAATLRETARVKRETIIKIRELAVANQTIAAFQDAPLVETSPDDQDEEASTNDQDEEASSEIIEYIE